MAGIQDILAALFKDPSQPDGGMLYGLLNPQGAVQGSTNTPTGPSPAAPAAGSPFLPQGGLLGESLFGRGVRGALAGLAGSTGYTGLSALGAGAQASQENSMRRQQFKLQNMLSGQQYAKGNQDLASGNLSLAQMVAQYNIWNKALNPNAPDLTVADVQGDPGKLASLMSQMGGVGAASSASPMPTGSTPPQLAQNVNPMAPPASGPPASAPQIGGNAAPSATASGGSPLDNLSSGFASLHNGMSPQQWASLGFRLRASGSPQGQAMIDEATKYDPTVQYQVERAKALATPLNVRQAGVVFDPLTNTPVFQNPQKQDVYNPDTGRTETKWVTPAMGNGGPPANAPQVGGSMVNPNNPGNIRPVGSSTGFQKYPDLASGIVGVVNNLSAYGQKGINTVQGVVSTWAPPSDNNDTNAYIADVATKLGVKPDQPLNMSDPKVLTGLALAITNHEQGGLVSGNQNPTAAPSNPGSLPQGPSAADTEAMKGYTQQRLNFEQGVQPTLIGIQRMQAIAEALKQFKSGWGAEQMAHVNSIFKRLGMDPINSVDPAQFQIVVKNNFQAAVSQMQKYSSNPAAVSLSQAIDNFANGDLQPEANLAILAQAIGTSKWQLDSLKAMQKAKLGGTQDPNEFFLNWAENHPIQGYIDQSTKDIGPLAGMNSGPQGSAAPSGVTKVWKMDASGNLVPAQ